MNERMMFPWEVEEEKPGVTFIGAPDGTEEVDPECQAVQALPDLVEALKCAEGALDAFGDGGNDAAASIAAMARKALAKAGVEGYE